MTDTTDIAALMRDMRDLADRIVECQGENSDGEEIIHLYDQSDTTFKAQNILLVLNAFEEERQRCAEITEQYVDRTTALSFATQRAEAAETQAQQNLNDAKILQGLWAAADKERDRLKSSHSNMVTRCALLRQRTDLPVDRIPAYNALVKAQDEIAVLREKLANPVVLPAGYSARAGHPFHEGERNVMIPNKHGDWLSRFEVEHAIQIAGYLVKDVNQ